MVGTTDMDVAFAVIWSLGNRGCRKRSGILKLLIWPFSYVPDTGASSLNAWPLLGVKSSFLLSFRAVSLLQLTDLQQRPLVSLSQFQIHQAPSSGPRARYPRIGQRSDIDSCLHVLP